MLISLVVSLIATSITSPMKPAAWATISLEAGPGEGSLQAGPLEAGTRVGGLSTVASPMMMILEDTLSKLLHHIAIFPGMSGRFTIITVFRTRSFEGFLISERATSRLLPRTVILPLTFILCACVCHQIRATVVTLAFTAVVVLTIIVTLLLTLSASFLPLIRFLLV